jgi:hypothetical protein
MVIRHCHYLQNFGSWSFFSGVEDPEAPQAGFKHELYSLLEGAKVR